VKTYRWLTLVAAVVITLCEVLVFNGQAGGGRSQEQADIAAATNVGSDTSTHPSRARIASVYWAASGVATPKRVR
jgi:hypothetical protein